MERVDMFERGSGTEYCRQLTLGKGLHCAAETGAGQSSVGRMAIRIARQLLIRSVKYGYWGNWARQVGLAG